MQVRTLDKLNTLLSDAPSYQKLLQLLTHERRNHLLDIQARLRMSKPTLENDLDAFIDMEKEADAIGCSTYAIEKLLGLNSGWLHARRLRCGAESTVRQTRHYTPHQLAAAWDLRRTDAKPRHLPKKKEDAPKRTREPRAAKPVPTRPPVRVFSATLPTPAPAKVDALPDMVSMRSSGGGPTEVEFVRNGEVLLKAAFHPRYSFADITKLLSQL